MKSRSRSTLLASRLLVFEISLVFALVLLLTIPNSYSKKTDPEKKPEWAKKDIRDYSDADLERLLEQWEENEEPLPPDELPEYMRPPKEGLGIDLSNLASVTPDEIMKMSKKGKTVMMFINLKGSLTKNECETLTSLWQGALRNNHLQAERYVIEETRAIFLFHDGSQAWDAKDFLLEQKEIKDITLEGQVYKPKQSSDSETSESSQGQKVEL